MTTRIVGVESSSGGGAGAPGVPLNLSPTLRYDSGLGAFVVDLTWNAPVSNGGSAITDYAVQYSSDDGSSWNTFSDGTSSSTSATVTGLSGATTYVFRVAAVNVIGQGPYTAKSSPVEITASNPDPPTGVSGTRGNAQVSLTWTAPGNTGGVALSDYVIQYSSDSGSSWNTFNDGVSTATSAIVTSLINGTSYIFRVAAVNNATLQSSYSTPSSAVTPATTPSAPTSLVSTPGNQQLSIAFTAGSNGGDAITNYQYALSTNGGSSYGAWTAFSPADTTSPVVITGLTNGQAYYVKLRAINSVGDGAESSPVSTGTTPRGLPIVNSITVDRFNQDRATFNATISANGGTLSSVTFQYSTSSGFGTYTEKTAVGTTDAYFNETGLPVGTLHYVRVAATNEAGTTTSSSTSFTTWGIKETVLTQSDGNRTIPTITPRGGSRINPSIIEVVIFGGGGNYGTYGAAGGGGGYRSSASIEVTDSSGYVSWTVGAAGGGTTTISGLSGGSYSATGGGNGSNDYPAPPGAMFSGSSGSGTNTSNAAGASVYSATDKTERWGYGGGGGAGGAGSAGAASTSATSGTNSGGNGGDGVTVYGVEGGAGGGGSTWSGTSIGSDGTYGTYGKGARGNNSPGATAGVVRFKYYGV